MTLGYSVDELLPKARGGGQLKMGLVALSEDEWLQPRPDLSARAQGFADFPEAVQLSPQGEAPGRELAAMLGIEGDLPKAARAHWEDMCLLTRREGEDVYRLVGAAVAFPSDWRPADKIGLPLAAMHAPIQGFAEQLASGVDHFMARLRPGRLFGRCNWFITPTSALRWIADTASGETFAHVTAANAGETLFVRSERQTLRRLPETGAILFTIGVYIAPLGTLCQSNIARLADGVQALVAGEGNRRGSPQYAAALQGFAERRGAAITPAP